MRNVDDLLLIGSAPLETAEDMFRQVGAPLADSLGSIPDGEPGERRWWVHRLSYQVFNGHPELETIRRPMPDNKRRNGDQTEDKILPTELPTALKLTNPKTEKA